MFRSNRTHLTMMSFEEQDDASSLVPSSTTMSFDEEDSFSLLTQALASMSPGEEDEIAIATPPSTIAFRHGPMLP
jgi:hypothetical protein